MIITDEGEGKVKVEMNGEIRIIKANAIKLAKTLFDKDVKEKYTEDEMKSLGFIN